MGVVFCGFGVFLLTVAIIFTWNREFQSAMVVFLFTIFTFALGVLFLRSPANELHLTADRVGFGRSGGEIRWFSPSEISVSISWRPRYGVLARFFIRTAMFPNYIFTLSRTNDQRTGEQLSSAHLRDAGLTVSE